MSDSVQVGTQMHTSSPAVDRSDTDMPGLFGLTNTNRDFTKPDTWGKNQFNSSFPAALACYFGHRKLKPVYLKLGNDVAGLKVQHHYISVLELFGLPDELHDENYDFRQTPGIRFNFESFYGRYQDLVNKGLPKIDLVTSQPQTGLGKRRGAAPTVYYRALEVKLTALPDNRTYNLDESAYGSELVVRAPTIAYLALSLASVYADQEANLRAILEPVCVTLGTWQDPDAVRKALPALCDLVDHVLADQLDQQIPVLMQPIWKTRGKTLTLADQCFDIFVWSDFALTRLFVDTTRQDDRSSTISRHARTVVWLVKLLYDFACTGKMDFRDVFDRLTYGTKNDKAFAVPGDKTNPYMRCAELTTPRLPKEALREIILGQGQNFLSPERRLDAAILNSRLFPDPPLGTIMPVVDPEQAEDEVDDDAAD